MPLIAISRVPARDAAAASFEIGARDVLEAAAGKVSETPDRS